MGKLDMLKQKSAASAFFTSSVDMNTYDVKVEEPKMKTVTKKAELARPEKVKTEMPKQTVKPMKEVAVVAPKKEMMPKADNIAKNGKAKIMDVSADNQIKRCSYTLDNEVIRKVQIEAEENGTTAYEVLKKAFSEVAEEKVMMNIAEADKSNSQNKCYTINEDMFKQIRTKAFNADVTSSAYVNTTLKMYYHM
ncbi:MAG: hypothetical protein MJ245_07785 [Clostridia bacterium]|nr:hypothetical protein [Clostridia bacterium]